MDNKSRVIQDYPCLFHTAFRDNWESIQKHGLLSTSALLDLYEYGGAARDDIECAHRPKTKVITHPIHGQAIIRDQGPLNKKKLEECLKRITPCRKRMTPKEWYALLNGMVFFWTNRADLETMRAAYPNDDDHVLRVDTGKLLDRHEKQVRLCPINSGNTYYDPAPRGKDTFLPVCAFDFHSKKRVKELAVIGKVEDILDLLKR